MTYSEDDIVLFDQFIEGSISDKDRLLFEDRLQSDGSFKQLFDAYQADSKAIALAHDQIILESIGKAEKKYFTNKKRTIAVIVISALLLLTTASVTYYLFLTTTEQHLHIPILEQSINEEQECSPVSDTLDNETTTISIPHDDETDSKPQPPTIKKPKPVKLEVEPEISPTYTTITRNIQTTITKNSDHIIINCTQPIQSIIPFEKDGKQYLLLDRNLYVLTNEAYLYTNDNRPAELIQKSTGRGKKLTIELRYFDTSTQEIVNLNNTAVIVDQDTTDIQNLNIDATYQIPLYYFLPIDLINLSNYN